MPMPMPMPRSVRRHGRRSLVASACAATVVSALTAWAVLAGAAGAADEPEIPGPDPVRSVQINQIYERVSRDVPDPAKGAVPVAGFGFVGIDDVNQMLTRGVLPPGGDLRYALASQFLTRQWLIGLGVQQSFDPDPSAVTLATEAEPLFANWAAENGSATAESYGRESSTSPEDGATYDLRPRDDGSIDAEYTAPAGERTVTGTYRFEPIGPGASAGWGALKVDSYVLVGSGDDGVDVRGHVNVFGADAMAVSVGRTTYTIGMTGKTATGRTVGVSAAVAANGNLLGLSLGGVLEFDDFPRVNVRIDLAGVGADFRPDPAPGVTVTSGSGGSFRLAVDVDAFYASLAEGLGARR